MILQALLCYFNNNGNVLCLPSRVTHIYCAMLYYVTHISVVKRARCSSVVRAFAHGAMGRRIDPSWWTH